MISLKTEIQNNSEYIWYLEQKENDELRRKALGKVECDHQAHPTLLPDNEEEPSQRSQEQPDEQYKSELLKLQKEHQFALKEIKRLKYQLEEKQQKTKEIGEEEDKKAEEVLLPETRSTLSYSKLSDIYNEIHGTQTSFDASSSLSFDITDENDMLLMNALTTFALPPLK